MLEMKPGKMMLLPPAEGLCRICGVDHEPHMPHDGQSLFYHTRFLMRYGRDGTWADCCAHCNPDIVEIVRVVLDRNQIAWTAPPEGVEPISEPIDG